MQTGSGIGSPGGKGARGIFNIGKAQVMKMDKNSKNKVSIFCWFYSLDGFSFLPIPSFEFCSYLEST